MIRKGRVGKNLSSPLDGCPRSTCHTYADDYPWCLLVWRLSSHVIDFDEVGYEGIGEAFNIVQILKSRLALELDDFLAIEKVSAQEIGTFAIGVYCFFTLNRAAYPF